MIESIFFNPWIWIVPIIIAAMVFLAIICAMADAIEATVGMSVIALIVAGFYFGAMLPPYDASFYQTYRVTGELTTVESAFSGNEGTMSQVFIAEVEGVDYLIKSDDQRFRTITIGDDVNLVCGKAFRYFQEPWLDCAFGGR